MAFLVMGSLNYDDNYFLDHIVMPGETIASQTMESACGGKGFNQAVALAKAGAEVYLAGLVGEADGARICQEARENESRILFSEKKRVIPERPSSRSTRQARTVSYFLVEPIGSGRWNMWIRCWSIFRQKIF